MNIPGPQKVSPLIRIGFEEGVRRLEKALVGAGIPILFHKVIDYKTGYEKYYVLDGAAGTVKDIAARLENEDRLGRLFDMDVLDTNGRKLSREELGLPERRCFVCSEPAKGCARSRKHSLPVLIRNVERILTDFVLSHTQDSMKEALLGEVTATPKPGLVDLDNPGAHDDMDQETFKKARKQSCPISSAWPKRDGTLREVVRRSFVPCAPWGLPRKRPCSGLRETSIPIKASSFL